MFRDVPPPAPRPTALIVLGFAAGVICGIIVARAMQPVRVVRFFSVPPDALCEVPGAASAVDVRGPIQ